MYQAVKDHPGTNLEELTKYTGFEHKQITPILYFLMKARKIHRVPGGTLRKGFVYFVKVQAGLQKNIQVGGVSDIVKVYK